MIRLAVPCAVLCTMVAACSSFNMVPECAKTGTALAEVMIVPRGERPDAARIAALVTISQPIEAGAGYNERTCRADVAGLGETHAITYTIRQSEGVQGWGEYEVLPNPVVQDFIARLRQAYAN